MRWATSRQVSEISLRYLARRSPKCCSSGFFTKILPLSSTLCPRLLMAAFRPAARKAEGPISTPRRSWPKSSGTPRIRIFTCKLLSVGCFVYSGPRVASLNLFSELLLQSSLFDFSSHVSRCTYGERHDGERRVFFRESCEATSIHHKKVLDVVGLAIGIQHGRARIMTHPAGPGFVAGEAGGLRTGIDDHFAMRFIQDFFCLFPHFIPQGAVIITETKVNNRNRNPIRINLMRVHRDPVFRPRQHFPVSSHLVETRLKVSDALLERFAKPLQVPGVIGIHKAAELHLIPVAAGVITLLTVKIEARDVGMIRRAVVVNRRRAHEVFEITIGHGVDMSGQIAPDKIAGIGKAVGMLRRFGVQQQACRFNGRATYGENAGTDFFLALRGGMDD